MNEKVLTALVTCGATAILMWILGWIRTFLARRLMVSTPVERKVKKLVRTVSRQSLILDAITERQATHAQATIILANAVKSGDQAQVAKTLDLITASEHQFMAFVTSHATRDPEPEDEKQDE